MSVNEEKRAIMTTAEEHEYEGPSHPFWPSHVLNQTIIFYLVGGVLITLAILIPFHLHEKADPMVTPDGIKPEWYFLGSYQLLKYVPNFWVIQGKTLGVMMCALAAAATVFWPFLDALLEPRFGERFFRKIGTIALVVFLGLTLIGVVSERFITFRGQQYEIDLKGIPHRVEATHNTAPDANTEAGAAEDNAGEGNSH